MATRTESPFRLRLPPPPRWPRGPFAPPWREEEGGRTEKASLLQLQAAKSKLRELQIDLDLIYTTVKSNTPRGSQAITTVAEARVVAERALADIEAEIRKLRDEGTRMMQELRW